MAPPEFPCKEVSSAELKTCFYRSWYPFVGMPSPPQKKTTRISIRPHTCLPRSMKRVCFLLAHATFASITPPTAASAILSAAPWSRTCPAPHSGKQRKLLSLPRPSRLEFEHSGVSCLPAQGIRALPHHPSLTPASPQPHSSALAVPSACSGSDGSIIATAAEGTKRKPAYSSAVRKSPTFTKIPKNTVPPAATMRPML